MKNKLSMTPNFHSGLCILGFFILCLTYPIQGRTGEFDTYHYKLEVNNNDKVCSHMKEVYNQYFKRPFAVSTNLADYGEGGRYALSLLPGVKREPKLTMQARRSLQPSSPEFDAVKWQEGRTTGLPDIGIPDQPILVGSIDIDNDGTVETVIKESFMVGYLPSYHSMLGGGDSLFVFRNGDIDLTQQPINRRIFYDGFVGHRPPALITAFLNSYPARLTRPFTYEGMNYLSAYSQAWLKDDADPYQPPDREYMEVLQYRSGGDNLDKGKWSPLKIDTICQFRMTVAK